MVQVVAAGDHKFLERSVVALDMVEPRAVCGGEDQGNAVFACPLLDGFVVVRREVVLDEIKPLVGGVAPSKVSQEGEMLSPRFAGLVVSQKDIVPQVEGGVKMTHPMKSTVGRPPSCGLADGRPLVSRLRTNLQRTKFVQTYHPSVEGCPVLNLPVQRDDSFFLDWNFGSLDSFQVLVFW